jgi:hypothetical protein
MCDLIRSVTLEELARNLCEEANDLRPDRLVRENRPSSGVPGRCLSAPLQRYPALPAVRGKIRPAARVRKNLEGNPNKPNAGRRKGGLR